MRHFIRSNFRVYREHKSITLFLGPGVARIQWARHSGFFYREGDSRFTIWLRHCWTGWHTWRDESDY